MRSKLGGLEPATRHHIEERIAEGEAKLDEFDAALVQTDLTEALQNQETQRAAERAEQENAAFWFRRFMLSLQIGNGAGFLASAAIVGQVEVEAMPVAAVLAWAPAAYFACGTAVAGALPLILAAQAWAKDRPSLSYIANRTTWAMTASAIAFFLAGMASVVVELRQLGQPAVTHAAGPAPPSPSPAPPPPAGGPSGSPDG